MLNSIIFTELLEFCRVILTSTIRSENLYLLTTLLLSLHLELLEFCEHLSLKLDKCYPSHSCELIHKKTQNTYFLQVKVMEMVHTHQSALLPEHALLLEQLLIQMAIWVVCLSCIPHMTSQDSQSLECHVQASRNLDVP